MDKKVFLIGDIKSFMVNGIENGLRREDYLVDTVSPELNELEKLKTEARLWVLYLDGMPAGISRSLQFIRDELDERECYFFPIGNADELDEIERIIPKNFITRSFLRPLNVRDLAAELDAAVVRGTAAEEKKKILIVDDDTTMLKMLKNLLADKYHVFVANSGMNAIAFLSKNSVDLVLLDFEMPVVSGAKVLEMMRSEPQTADIPVMFLTGKNDRQSVMAAVPLHPEKYLLKSMAPEEWLDNIEEFFQKKKRKKNPGN